MNSASEQCNWGTGLGAGEFGMSVEGEQALNIIIKSRSNEQ